MGLPIGFAMARLKRRDGDSDDTPKNKVGLPIGFAMARLKRKGSRRYHCKQQVGLPIGFAMARLKLPYPL